MEVTRTEFHELTADLLERTAYTTRQLLTSANCEWSQVSRVLLVGGATRMPMVGEMLQKLSGIAPDHTVNPDEAVARGAAIYAWHLLAGEAEEGPGPSFQVTNVNSHSLGVEGIEQETLRKSNFVLIPRNTPLPARFTERFITKSAGQKSIVIQVLEGESSLPGECTAIGRTVIRDLPPGLPQGWPVEVTFEYGANGRLSVHASVPGTHREVELKIERAVGLSGEGIAKWQQAVGDAAGFDAFEAMVDEVLGTSASDSPGATASPETAASPQTAVPQQTKTPPEPPSADQSAPAGKTPRAKPLPPSDAAPPAPLPPGSVPQAQPTAGDSTPVEAPPLPGEVQGSKQAVPASPASADQDQPDWQPLEDDGGNAIPPWVLKLIGFAVSAIVGLGLGYLVIVLLSRWFPDIGVFQFWK